jgi:hypothetical protein
LLQKHESLKSIIAIIGENELSPIDRLEFRKAKELIQYFNQNFFVSEAMMHKKGEYYTPRADPAGHRADPSQDRDYRVSYGQTAPSMQVKIYAPFKVYYDAPPIAYRPKTAPEPLISCLTIKILFRLQPCDVVSGQMASLITFCRSPAVLCTSKPTKRLSSLTSNLIMVGVNGPAC